MHCGLLKKHLIDHCDITGVLDPGDESHHALLHKENLKPISMFRHQNSSILLCYNGMWHTCFIVIVGLTCDQSRNGILH